MISKIQHFEAQPQNPEFRNNPENSQMETVNILNFQTLFFSNKMFVFKYLP